MLMKFFPVFVLFTLGSVALAELDLPRGSFDFAGVSEAKKAAIADKKAIAYLYTAKDSNCGLCNHTADEFLKAVRSKAVIVHLESTMSQDYWAKLPEAVQKLLSVGKYIPKMVVTKDDGVTVIASINYDQFKADENDSIREFKKKLRAK
jgi:hypothetical protein